LLLSLVIAVYRARDYFLASWTELMNFKLYTANVWVMGLKWPEFAVFPVGFDFWGFCRQEGLLARDFFGRKWKILVTVYNWFRTFCSPRRTSKFEKSLAQS